VGVSQYLNWRTYNRSTMLYTRPELPYKEIVKHQSILRARICQLRQYKTMIQEYNIRLCLAMRRTSAEPECEYDQTCDQRVLKGWGIVELDQKSRTQIGANSGM